jgi:signal transduction histidine kinase
MTQRRFRPSWPVIFLSALVAGAIILSGIFFYVRAQSVMEQQLRSHLVSIAAASALAIDGDLIDGIDSAGDLQNPVYLETIRHLQNLRQQTGMRFVYILRRTDDSDNLAFVADADAALTPQQLDVNNNGTVDPDEESGYPGELYDITETPMLQGEAFEHPVADPAITVDQWGTLISGYAPILRKDGSVSAVLGVDMYADEFFRQSRRIFTPEAMGMVFLTALAAAGTIIASWERRRVSMLKRINNERSGLLRLTFHQLGEPLTIMKWSLETLRDETENPELKKLVDEHVVCMDEGLGRLNSIIDTLQLAEKVDLNTLEYLPVPSSLRALIDNAVNEWDSSLRAHGVKIDIQMKEDIDLPLDKTLLSLVLRQLLVNAIEYSDDKSVITVAVTPGRTSVEVAISDTGCGIPAKDMEHLFEKYRRASNAHLKKPDGNGLGLYIAKGIVEKAGGHIWVESEQGKGTTVRFILPL